MSKTIVIIPARGGSKRLIGKNIKRLGSYPLLAYSIKYALLHLFVDEVVVSTDCPAIAGVAQQFGATVVARPSSISGDYEPTVSALTHVLEELPYQVDTVILLQATNPLRPLDLLDQCFKVFQAGPYSSLFTVSRSHHKLGTITQDTFIPFNYTPGQRSQDLTPLYYENGLIYITKAAQLHHQEIITSDAYPYLVEHPFAQVDIDTQDDFDYAAYLIHKYHYQL